MLILRHLALVSAIFHQGTQALPVPLYINLEAPSQTQPLNYEKSRSDYSHSFRGLYDQSQMSMPTNTETAISQSAHWKDADTTLLNKRGVVSFSVKSAFNLFKSALKNGVKGGAQGVAKNGAKAMFQIEKRNIQQEEGGEERIVARADQVKESLIPKKLKEKSKNVEFEHRSGNGIKVVEKLPHRRSLGLEDEIQQDTLVARNPSAAPKVTKKRGLFKKKPSLGGITNVVMLGSMLGPIVAGAVSKLTGHGSKPAEVAPAAVAPAAEPAALHSISEHPTSQHPTAQHSTSQHPTASHHEVKPFIAEKLPSRRSLKEKDYLEEHALITRDVETPTIREKGHELRKFGSKSNKVLNVAGSTASIASIGIWAAPHVTKMFKHKDKKEAKTTGERKVDKNPDAQSSDKKKYDDSPIIKRSLYIDELETAMVKRGQVLNAAGALVTTLMFVNIGKGALQAIMPHHKKNVQQYQYPPGQYPPQYSRRSLEKETNLFKRQDRGGDPRNNGKNPPPRKQGPPRSSPPPPPSRKASVMEGMGTFVTLGFGWQALQEHIPAMFREIKRVAHAGMKKLSTTAPYAMPVQMNARGLLIQDDSPQLVGRGLSTLEEEGEVLQRRVPPALQAAWPKLLNGASHVVTVSMVTGMAGPLIDKLIKTFKGPSRPDNKHANQMNQMMGMMRPMRRSLIPIEESERLQSHRQSVQPISGSVLAQTLSSDVVKPNRTTGKRLSEDGDVDQEPVLEKRFNLGRAAKNIMKNKVVKGLVNTAITLV